MLYQKLREEFFSEADAIDQVTQLTPEQQSQYSLFLGDGFGPNDAWGMALNYEAEEDEEDDEEPPIPVGYSGDGFLETPEEIKYELNNAIATRSLCRRYGRNGKEKQEQLVEYDRRIDRLEHLLKNFENTASTEVEAWHSSPKSVNEASKVTLSFISNLWSEMDPINPLYLSDSLV